MGWQRAATVARMDVTIEQVLVWLPPDIAAEFDCVRGPHEWASISAATTTWTFCKRCPKKKRIDSWPDTPRHLNAFDWRL